MAITGRRFWLERGWMPVEASSFKNISTDAIVDSRYIQVMIQTRQRRYREFYQQHEDVRNVKPLYYKWVRSQYVRRGITSNPDILKDVNDTSKTLAFDFFNQYKDRYALRDTSGKVVKTPRKKARASRKPITGNKAIDQVIRKYKDDIEVRKIKIRNSADKQYQAQLNTEIKRMRTKIKDLKAQKSK